MSTQSQAASRWPLERVLFALARLRSAIYPNPTDAREPAFAPTAREEVTV